MRSPDAESFGSVPSTMECRSFRPRRPTGWLPIGIAGRCGRLVKDGGTSHHHAIGIDAAPAVRRFDHRRDYDRLAEVLVDRTVQMASDDRIPAGGGDFCVSQIAGAAGP